jgi:two-component sensor histidine kinase
LRKIWDKLINYGLQESESARFLEHIRSINFIVLVWIPILALLSILCFQSKYSNYGLLTFFITLLMIFILAVNKNKNLIVSTATFLLSVNFILMLINVMLEFNYGTFLYFFPLFTSVTYLFPLPRFKANLTLTLSVMISLHLCSYIIIYEFPSKNFIETPHLLLTTLNHIAAFSLTFILVLKFNLLQSRQKKQLDNIIIYNNKQNVLLEETLKDKNILLSEIHHRTKNNLAIVSSILNLQRSQVDSKELDSILLDCSNRVHSIAAVHQKLYEKGDFSIVDFQAYMGGLIEDLQQTIFPKDKKIVVITEIESFDIKTDQAVSCALIMNEVITNSIKYAFNEPYKKHQIDIRVSRISNQIVLMIHDNGPGFELYEQNQHKSSLGMSLVEALTEQLEGSYEYHHVGGTTFTLTFKLN